MTLNCAVVGAGIAGLAAGIALRKSRHTVTVFEKSNFKNEIGAALTITPNGNRVLEHWHFDVKAAGETTKQQGRFVDPESLALITGVDFSNVEARFGSRFNAFHRVDLHQGLKELAEGLGVKIVLGKEVLSIDCENGELRFRNGAAGEWDLIIVADGIKGNFVHAISGRHAPLLKTGKSVFRGLAPMDLVMRDPLIRPIFADQGSGLYATLSQSGIYIMTYPCRNHEVLNIAVFHDTRAGHEDDEGWSSPAPVEEVLGVLDGLHPAWKAMVRCAGDGMKCFPVMLRESLPRYNKGKAVLIGDAAHCMMPTHAQGGSISLEDAAALEILFPPDFDAAKESVAGRLQLFNDFRLPRDNTVQLYSNVQMPRNASDREASMKEHLARVREFYAGPLMPMESVPWGEERQDFFYPYDVFEQARKAMQLRDRDAGLMQDEIKHFF